MLDRSVAKSFPFRNLERAKGIEPSYEAWEAVLVPLIFLADF